MNSHFLFRYPYALRTALLTLPLALGACSSPTAPRVASLPVTLKQSSLAPTLCSDVQDMYVVAHQDDDLLFMNPDVSGSLSAGHCVFTVYLTTGDNPVGVNNYNLTYGTAFTPAYYAQQREAGVLAAYARMAKVSNVWTRSTLVTRTGTTMAIATLNANQRVVLAFMRLPEDADKAANGAVATLDDLYFNVAPSTTSSDGVTYTREGLVSTLTDLMTLAQPKYLHFQDSDPDPFIKDAQGNTMSDHVDHIIGARFVVEAENQYPPLHTRVRYRDYNINAENTPNLSTAQVTAKSKTFGVYASNDMLICPPATDCTDITLFPNWMATDYQGWLQRQYFNIADDQEGDVVSVKGGGGRLQVFMTGDRTSTIRTIRQASAGSTSFNPWNDLGGNFSAKPVVAAYADGRLTAFVHDNTGSMFYSFQKAVNGGWTPWRRLGGDGVSDAALVLNQQTKVMQLFVVNNGGEIISSVDSTGYGDWNQLTSLIGNFPGALVSSNPSVTQLSGGRITLFVRDDAGNVQYTTQTRVGSPWTAWTSLGGGFMSAPVADANAAGRLDVFIRGNDNGLYTRSQDNQNVWSAWRKLEFGALQFVGQPTVANGPTGRTEVFVRDLDTSIVRFTRPSPTSPWNTPERLPTTVRAMSILGASFDGSGALNVMVRGADGQVYTNVTTTATGGWKAWANLGN